MRQEILKSIYIHSFMKSGEIFVYLQIPQQQPNQMLYEQHKYFRTCTALLANNNKDQG